LDTSKMTAAQIDPHKVMPRKIGGVRGAGYAEPSSWVKWLDLVGVASGFLSEKLFELFVDPKFDTLQIPSTSDGAYILRIYSGGWGSAIHSEEKWRDFIPQLPDGTTFQNNAIAVNAVNFVIYSASIFVPVEKLVGKDTAKFKGLVLNTAKAAINGIPIYFTSPATTERVFLGYLSYVGQEFSDQLMELLVEQAIEATLLEFITKTAFASIDAFMDVPSKVSKGGQAVGLAVQMVLTVSPLETVLVEVGSPFEPKFDAGYPDSGTTDAGQDAGSDAGTPDSGGGKDGGVKPCTPGVDCPVEEMVDVPAGSFQMGCNIAVDTECYSNENPYHAVTVPSFRIDKYEVMNANFKKCVDAGACTNHWDDSKCYVYNGSSWDYGVLPLNFRGDYQPVVCVDWSQAEAYCAWAGKRLPSEAEWEKAARGTDGRKYPWGNTGLDCDHAVWNYTTCGNSSTQPVGSKPPGVSPYGAMDMIGNVWEWVEDDYHSTYTGAPVNGAAWVDSPRASHRVLRGGSWDSDSSRRLRASSRARSSPSDSVNDYGFRCAQ
jgi:formylglycine-generating enzyme required for sulfatase activity